MYEEKKRERRRRDAARRKAAVKRYSWFHLSDDPTGRIVGKTARSNHTCVMCGKDRRLFGPSFNEVRRRSATQDGILRR